MTDTSESSTLTRRLTAILAADVVGYSHAMSQDEVHTLGIVREIRGSIFEPLIRVNQGRLVKLMGDGFLVEFSSVINAVKCACEVQDALGANELRMPDGQPVLLRVGVNIGDVVIEDEDIYGEGVNVAARLESIAAPGSVYISSKVYKEIEGKSSYDFLLLGEKKLKNIPHPEIVYAWPAGLVDPVTSPTTANDTGKPAEKPSIAVLPFENRSSDPEQEFFADGISEDITTQLARFKSLFVIARKSAFSFKGKNLGAKEISNQLGVRYLVEGSIRRAGNRIRVSAQLVDTQNEVQLWANNFDRDLSDIFEVQDEVVNCIVQAIEPELMRNERNKAIKKPTENLDAWENYQRGLWHTYRYKPEDCLTAFKYFDQAIEIDSYFSSAYSGKAFATYIYKLVGGTSAEISLEQGVEYAKRGIAIEPDDPFAYVAMGRAFTMLARHDEAVAACDKAISLNPNFATAHFGRAHALMHSGRSDIALESHDEAMRLSPQDPMLWAYMASKAIALYMLDRYDEALDESRKSQQMPNASIFAFLAEICVLAERNEIDNANISVQSVLKIRPDLTIEILQRTLPITDTFTRQKFFSALAKAGISDR